MSKVVLITGASSGFGEAIAVYLSRQGYKVYGTSRKSGTKCSSRSYEMIAMDVQNQVSVQEAIDQIVAQEGTIDVLINNAGISVISPLEETPLDMVDDIMNTNLYGVLRVCQAVLPVMRHQNSGLIINISSIGGLIGLPFRGIYSASKFALEGLTESLSMEVKPFGISVCLIEPGDFKTSITQNRLDISLAQNSVYQRTCQDLAEVADQQIQNAPSPDIMGPFINNIIEAKKPKLRYKIGSFSEKISPVLKKFLPDRWFEKIILYFYKL